jgi:hypothetical protein
VRGRSGADAVPSWGCWRCGPVVFLGVSSIAWPVVPAPPPKK